MARWAKFAETGETIEMVEETWTLAAEMVCKALFDREMPFNPHFVFRPGEDLHRRDEPQVDPPQERARRA